MTESKNNNLPISDVEALLPWHAAGTLDSREAAGVEKPLANVPELARPFVLVQVEVAETIKDNAALRTASARVLEKLFKAIDKERKVVRRESGSSLAAWFAGLFSP